MFHGLVFALRRITRRPITLGDLFQPGELQQAVDDGFVRVQHHPVLPYDIYNYTETCAYSRAWGPVTVACRGLIAHRDTGRILARALPKFWNHNEPESTGLFTSAEPVTVTEKADGSLGILYPTGPGAYAVATRGSFASVQALHASRVWHERYAQRWTPPAGKTPLFEIVYPENRIVLDYEGMDDLILIGFVDTRTGRTYGPDDFEHGWPGPAVRVLPYQSFAEALADEPTEGVEGYVVHFVQSDRRAKIKGSWYLQLHRLVTGISSRVLWEHLAVNACNQHASVQPKFLVQRLMMSPDRIERVLDAGPEWEKTFVEGIPDELHRWMITTISGLRDTVAALRREILADFTAIDHEARGDRKEFALLAKGHPDAGALFALRDGKEIVTYLWREVRPTFDAPFVSPLAEEAA